ncbi:MAG: glycosyltransferase family 39 protein, partial [Saprospiraceae bacterium]
MNGNGFSKAELRNLIHSPKGILGMTLFVILANFFFKLFFLTDAGLNYDEIFSVYYAQGSKSSIRSVGIWDISAPFYYHTLHYWEELFGVGEASVRIFNIVLNALAGGSLYFFVRRYFGFFSAILASVLFFSSNILFFYAQEVRPYALLLLFSIISSGLFLEILKKPKWWLFIPLGILNWAAIYSHYLFVLIPFFQTILVIAYWKRKSIIYFGLSGFLTLGIFYDWIWRMIE